MKALLTCPTCGYQMVGVGVTPDEALTAGIAGMQRHQMDAHAVPMTSDRWITALRMGKTH